MLLLMAVAMRTHVPRDNVQFGQELDQQVR